MTTANVEDIYELAPMQQGILHHISFAPSSESYFTYLMCRLQGELDAESFRDAWREVIQRHPALRTSFLYDNDKPLQVVHRRVHLPLEELDWRSLDTEVQQKQISEYLALEQRQGFDVAEPPIMRLTLVRLGEQDYQFLWTQNHLLLDGWSMSIVLREVFLLYEAFRRGQTVDLPPAAPFGDYIGWMQQQDRDAAADFWRKRLAGYNAAIDLRIDTLSQVKPSHDIDDQRLEIELNAADTRALQDFARQHQLTLNTLVQGAWALLLSRYSGEQDVVFGSIGSGRPADLPGIESMVGLLVNTLPVRVFVSDRQPLLDWLHNLQSEQAQMSRYGFLPLTEIQRVSEIPSRQSLFSTLYVYENYPINESLLRDGLSLLPSHPQFLTRINQPLTLVAGAAPNLFLKMVYDARRFDRSSVQQILNQLEFLLLRMVAQPQVSLADMPMCDLGVCSEVIQQFSCPAEPAVSNTLLLDEFEAMVNRAPQAIAVTDGTIELSYAELDVQINRLANYLQSQGAGPEVIVAVSLERSVQQVVALLAVLKAGAAYVPLDPAYPRERLEFMLEDTGAPFVLTSERLAALLPEVLPQIHLDGIESQLQTLPDSPPPRQVVSEQLAYIIYTSGSTGQPKGTMISHRGLCNLAAAQREAFTLSADSRVLQFASTSYDASVSEIFVTLLAGATLHVSPPEEMLPGQNLFDLLQQRQITTVTLPPSVLSVLPREPLPKLATLVSAGEPLSRELAEAWSKDRRLINAYGPTEATVCASTWPYHPQWHERMPIGRPIRGVQLYVLDAVGTPQAPGVPGELCIGGIGIARGYLNRPDLTASQFIPDVFSGLSGARLYRTGDLCRWRSDGELEFLSRIDAQVKVRGIRIEPGEIEAALLTAPGVREAVVIAREDLPGQRRLVAYIVLETTEDVPPISALRSHLSNQLPETLIPGVFVILESLPRTSGGKLDRRALPAPDSGRLQLASQYVAPRNELERYLAKCWQELLQVEQIGIYDDFFELGGDSIQGSLLVNRLQEELGEYVYTVALFDAPNIANLAQYLLANNASAVERKFGSGIVADSPQRLSRTIEPSHAKDFRSLLRSRNSAPRTKAKNPSAVFILSPPRSGSTLLRTMLAGHPQLFAPPELQLLNFESLAERQAAFDNDRDRFWLDGPVRSIMELQSCDASAAQAVMDDCLRRNLTTGEFYGLLQSWLDNRLFVDKTPFYALDRESLAQAEVEFDEAIYIHLMRHPAATIASFSEAKLHTLLAPFFSDLKALRGDSAFSPRELAELMWLVCHQNIVDFLDHVPAARQCSVQFEQLVTQPTETMQQICTLLNLPMDERVLQPHDGSTKRMTDAVHPQAKMLGDIKFHSFKQIEPSVAQRWQNVRLDSLGDITWELAAKLGYKRTVATDVERGPVVSRPAATSSGPIQPRRRRPRSNSGEVSDLSTEKVRDQLNESLASKGNT